MLYILDVKCFESLEKSLGTDIKLSKIGDKQQKSSEIFGIFVMKGKIRDWKLFENNVQLALASLLQIDKST